jgi:hypothetical protein
MQNMTAPPLLRDEGEDSRCRLRAASSFVLEGHVDEPGKDREDDRTEKRAPESRDQKSWDDERHAPEKERVQDEGENTERKDRDRQGENVEHRLNKKCDDRPDKRGQKHREPPVGNGDARHDVYRQ